MAAYLYIMKFVLYAILAYLLYQFIFKLVIPVYMASRKIKKGFREMQSKMQDQPFDFSQRQQEDNTAQPPSPKPELKTKASDYIEYEELK